MAVVIDKSLEEKLERVKKREWWPVALLAEVLGRPKCFIYRRIEHEDFDVFMDGGYIKILSKSVIKYFHEKLF